MSETLVKTIHLPVAPASETLKDRVQQNWNNRKVQVIASGTSTALLAGGVTAAALLGPIGLIAGLAVATFAAFSLFLASLAARPRTVTQESAPVKQEEAPAAPAVQSQPAPVAKQTLTQKVRAYVSAHPYKTALGAAAVISAGYGLYAAYGAYTAAAVVAPHINPTCPNLSPLAKAATFLNKCSPQQNPVLAVCANTPAAKAAATFCPMPNVGPAFNQTAPISPVQATVISPIGTQTMQRGELSLAWKAQRPEIEVFADQLKALVSKINTGLKNLISNLIPRPAPSIEPTPTARTIGAPTESSIKPFITTQQIQQAETSFAKLFEKPDPRLQRPVRIL